MLYVYAMSATKFIAGKVANDVRPGVCRADNMDAATDIVCGSLLRTYPVSDGWTMHNFQILEPEKWEHLREGEV